MATNSKQYRQGFKAAAYRTTSVCPYAEGTAEYKLWQSGFKAGWDYGYAYKAGKPYKPNRVWPSWCARKAA